MHRIYLVVFLLTILPGLIHADEFAAWAAIREPTTGAPEPIGGFAAGCLRGALKIPAEGVGYAVMHPKRNRVYAHPLMKAYLENLGKRTQAAAVGILLVGDIGPPRGGPMLSGHSSHQTGLDVDLWLRLSRQRPDRRERETWGAPSFIRGRKKLLPTWGPRQTKLIELAADDPKVNRIFVSPPIKQFLCKQKSKAPWLYKIRPWWGHEEHVHVRLSCPPEAKECVAQPDLNPKDPGCNKDLKWWFSAEADKKWTEIKNDKKPREFPILSKTCESIKTSAEGRK